jgi:microcompartment protein CcmK/EutM
MILARVIGTVVSTRKEEKIEGIKFLLLEKLDPRTMRGKGDYLVAMDAVGAGMNEVVFYVAGSSSRMTAVTEGRPSDATITAIVDEIEIQGKLVYQKDALNSPDSVHLTDAG